VRTLRSSAHSELAKSSVPNLAQQSALVVAILTLAAYIKHHLVASKAEAAFCNARPVGLRKPPRNPVAFLDAQWKTVVIGHAHLMLPLSALPDLQNSVLVRLCAPVEFVLRMPAVTNIAVPPISVVTLVTSSETMLPVFLVVAVALTVFAVFHEHVLITLVLLTRVAIQTWSAVLVVAVSQYVAPELVLLLSAV